MSSSDRAHTVLLIQSEVICLKMFTSADKKGNGSFSNWWGNTIRKEILLKSKDAFNSTTRTKQLGVSCGWCESNEVMFFKKILKIINDTWVINV